MKTNEVKTEHKGSVKKESQPGKSKNASADFERTHRHGQNS